MRLIDKKRLRARLALLGWTQGSLAEKVGVSPWEMSRMVAGHNPLEDDTAGLIAKVLGCKVPDFSERFVKVDK
jgi:plasmid maintenance system antidote protein VapI